LIIPRKCLAGRAVIETHDDGSIANDYGITAALGNNLEPAFDRRNIFRIRAGQDFLICPTGSLRAKALGRPQ